MERATSRWTTHGDWWALVWLAIGMLFLQFGTALVFGSANIGFAIVVPVVLVFGPLAGAALALGAALAEIVAGPSSLAILRFGEVVVLTIAGWLLWRQTTPAWSVGARGGLSIAIVAGIAALVSIGVSLTVLPTVVGLGGFTQLPVLLLERLLPAIVVAPVLYVGFASLGNRPVVPGRGSGRSMVRTLSGVGVLAIAWVSSATILDIVRRDVAAYPHIQSYLVRPMPGVIGDMIAFGIGPRGGVLYGLLGVGSLAMMWVVLRYWGEPPAAVLSSH